MGRGLVKNQKLDVQPCKSPPEKLWVRYFDQVGSHNFKPWLNDDDSHEDKDKDTDGSGTKIESRILVLLLGFGVPFMLETRVMRATDTVIRARRLISWRKLGRFMTNSFGICSSIFEKNRRIDWRWINLWRTCSCLANWKFSFENILLRQLFSYLWRQWFITSYTNVLK